MKLTLVATLATLLAGLVPASLATASASTDAPLCTLTRPANAPARFLTCVEPAGDIAILSVGSHCVAGERKLPQKSRITCDDDTVLVIDGSDCDVENDPGHVRGAARCSIEPAEDAAIHAHLR